MLPFMIISTLTVVSKKCLSTGLVIKQTLLLGISVRIILTL